MWQFYYQNSYSGLCLLVADRYFCGRCVPRVSMIEIGSFGFTRFDSSEIRFCERHEEDKEVNMNIPPPPVVHFIYQSQTVSTVEFANHATSLA